MCAKKIQKGQGPTKEKRAGVSKNISKVQNCQKYQIWASPAKKYLKGQGLPKILGNGGPAQKYSKGAMPARKYKKRAVPTNEFI